MLNKKNYYDYIVMRCSDGDRGSNLFVDLRLMPPPPTPEFTLRRVTVEGGEQCTAEGEQTVVETPHSCRGWTNENIDNLY